MLIVLLEVLLVDGIMLAVGAVLLTWVMEGRGEVSNSAAVRSEGWSSRQRSEETAKSPLLEACSNAGCKVIESQSFGSL